MKKVYIIDDDANIVESLSIILQAENFEVRYQNDEKDAVANITAFAPDLVILDVIFPEDDLAGFKIAKDLKSNPGTAGIPVMLLSAINEKNSFAGGDLSDLVPAVEEFIEKPVNPKILMAKVRKLTR